MSQKGSKRPNAPHHCPKLLIWEGDWCSRPNADIRQSISVAMALPHTCRSNELQQFGWSDDEWLNQTVIELQ